MNSEKKLLSIGNVAASLGITRRMILNYEDRGLLRPDVREGEMGNRYYTLDTLTRIRAIRTFQDMGLSLDEIRAYLDDSTDLVPMLERLETLRDELNLNIEKLRERIKSTGEAGGQIVTIPHQTVYRQTFRSATVAERIQQLRNTGLFAIREYGSDVSRRMYFAEYSSATPDLFSFCVAVLDGSEGKDVEVLPETQALCIYHHGAYEELPAVRDRLLAAAGERALPLTSVCRHIYLEGPPQHRNPEKFITQVALLLATPTQNSEK